MIGPEITKISTAGRGTSPATLQVDVIADLICPWCYLGKKRLDDALSAVRGPSIVSWFPFQLNPDMPMQGMAFADYLSSKFGEPEKLESGLAALVAAGKAAGIDFRFDLISIVPNTLNAHRLMGLSALQGADTSLLAERILSSFFSSGEDISDREILVQAGESVGLARGEVLLSLEDEKSRSSVLAQESQVRLSGVTGVPDFLVNKRLFVVGAQTTENLVNVFDRVMFGEDSDSPVSPILH